MPLLETNCTPLSGGRTWAGQLGKAKPPATAIRPGGRLQRALRRVGRLISNDIFSVHKPRQWGVSWRPMCRLVSDQWTASVALPTTVSVVKIDVHRLSTTPTPCVSSCCSCCGVPRQEQCWGHPVCAVYIDKCIPTLRGWCFFVFV